MCLENMLMQYHSGCYCVPSDGNYTIAMIFDCYRTKLFDHVATKSLYFTHPISTAHDPVKISDKNLNAITKVS